MSKTFAEGAIARERTARIVNIVFAHIGANPLFAHAQAARAAIVNLTKTLAVEWGYKGILVNAVGPGSIRTEGHTAYLEANDLTDTSERLPVPREGTPAEVAAAVAFLCSDAGSYITGTFLPVDGGDSLMGPDPSKVY